jgi:hypothetical protein
MALFNKKQPAPLTAAATPGKFEIYLPVFREGGSRTIVAQPGVKHPDVPEWMDRVPLPWTGVASGHEGNRASVPRTLTVVFRDGKAEVDKGLAEYLVAEGIASATPGRAWAPGDAA